MNVVEVKRKEDLNFILANSEILITQDFNRQLEEIDTNMRCISLSEGAESLITKNDFLKFVRDYIHMIEDKICKHEITPPLAFYMWVDVMARQLRFNCISVCSDMLPFGSKIKIINNHDEIVDRFLNLTVPNNVGSTIEKASEVSDNEQDEFIVIVFCQLLK